VGLGVAEELLPDELLDLFLHRLIDPSSLHLYRSLGHDNKGL
jgi:hypothetical protein